MSKPKTRTMKVQISCKRAGVPKEGFACEWQEPEDRAMKTFAAFHKELMRLLKEHGLMDRETNSTTD